MGKHSTKGQRVLKRDRKLEGVYRAMPPQSSIEEHMAKFKELYPEDWNSLVYRYSSKREAQPEVVTEHPQPEAVTEHPQPEAHPEAMTEHPQPTV